MSDTTLTYGSGDHNYTVNCCDCGQPADFRGEDNDGIRDAMKNSEWQPVLTESSESPQHRCPRCVEKRRRR